MSRHHLASLLLFTLHWISFVCSLNVDDVNAGVVYSSSVPSNWRRAVACKLRAAKCLDGWWVEHSDSFRSGSLHLTSGPIASASFEFRGTSIHIIGSTFPQGATALVAVDGEKPCSIDFSSGNGLRVDGVRLFTREGLSSTKLHTIRVSYEAVNAPMSQYERRFLALDAFTVDESTDGTTASDTFYTTTPTISSTSGTVAAREDDILTTLSHDLYASDETSTSSTAIVTNWTRDPGEGLQTGQIAAISVVCGVLFSAFICSVVWCIRMRILSGPRRVLPSSRQGESILSWSFGSSSRSRNRSARTGERHRMTLPNTGARATRAALPSLTISASRDSFQAQRTPSPIEDITTMTPCTPSPISPANSLTPLTLPRRVASTADSTRRGPPPPFPLSGVHPHAAVSTPRHFGHSQVVVIPPSPVPTLTAPPPPYTPRSRGRAPRTLDELREKMSPYTP